MKTPCSGRLVFEQLVDALECTIRSHHIEDVPPSPATFSRANKAQRTSPPDDLY
jgi:hypothetical protein